jgi:hypothetical protein
VSLQRQAFESARVAHPRIGVERLIAEKVEGSRMKTA